MRYIFQVCVACCLVGTFILLVLHMPVAITVVGPAYTAYEQIMLHIPVGLCTDTQHIYDWSMHKVQPLIEDGYVVYDVRMSEDNLVVELHHSDKPARTCVSEFATIPCPKHTNPFF